jgi:hypothetical protein
MGRAPALEADALLASPPSVGDLVVLPSPQTRREPGQIHWPEVAPEDDPLLKM